MAYSYNQINDQKLTPKGTFINDVTQIEGLATSILNVPYARVPDVNRCSGMDFNNFILKILFNFGP